MQQRRDELVALARPPERLFERVSAEEIRLGAGLNQAYTAALRMGRKRAASANPARGQYASVLERAKEAAEDYLAHFPPERRGGILLGALASVYGKEQGGSDTAVWLAGHTSEPERLWPGSGHLTIEALRRIGLLDDIIVTKEGLVVYPAGLGVNEGE
jgi:hypothetical protein